jgi:anti-sigma regulatory factor (Ser/Thr protein kinase)
VGLFRRGPSLSCHDSDVAASPETPDGTAARLQVEAVLDIVLSSAGRLLLGEGGSVMFLVAPDELEVVCSPGNPAALGARVRFGEGVAGQVAQTCDPVLVSGRAGRRSKPVDSAMSVPLMHQGRIFGVLNINARDGHSFTDHDLKAAYEFCRHAADALAAAQRYEVARRNGVNDAGPHLEAMIGHLAHAGSVDFVEPRRGVLVDAAKVARDAAEAAARAGRPTDLRAPLSVPVLADARHLRRALGEVIDNGHVHGGAPVRIVIEADEDVASITIADAGRGIPAADRDRVFDAYTRLDLPDGPSGLGLGLTIARRLVESFGGSIVVDETPVGGAAVRIVLPRQAGPRQTD